MSFERLVSFLLALCLHLAIATLALFWPSPKMLVEAPRGAFIPGIITIGKAGKDIAGSKQEIPEPSRGRPDKPRSIDKPQADASKTVASVAKPDKPAPKPDVKPIAKPEPAPVEQPPVKAIDKPAETPVTPPVEKAVETPAPDSIPIPREPEKPPVKPAEPVKPEPPADKPEPAPKEEPPVKKPEPPAQKPKPPAQKPTPPKPPSKSNLDNALADLNKQVGGTRQNASGKGAAPKGKGQDLSSALSDLGKQVGSSGGANSGRGPGGSGGDGYGTLGAYQDSIISRVRPNWSWPGRTDRRNYTAVVNIQIDPDGSITNARIISSSGNSFFDATVLRAVAATHSLEPPPNPAYADINISFTPEALGAR